MPGVLHAPKCRALPVEPHPDIHFSAMIPRRGVKIKIFLSVVIYVVKAAFVPFSATGGNPANAGVARLCGVSPCPVPDTATALPNVAPYQLSHTRIFNFCHYTTAGRKIKDFLSVVIPVVKTAFVPFSATGEKPAIACAARLCGLLSKPRMDRVYALPNQARYQLRYTRIKICRPHPGGISTIPAFFLACKGKICLGAFCIPGAFPPPPDYSPRAAFRASTRSVFSQATPRSSRPIWP